MQPARAAALLLVIEGRMKSLAATTVRRYGRKERYTDVVVVVLVRYGRREKCTDDVILVVSACNQRELLHLLGLEGMLSDGVVVVRMRRRAE